MPALGHRWWALPREARCVLRRAAASTSPRSSELADAHALLERHPGMGRGGPSGRPRRAGSRACWRTRGVGDAWQYMLVAEGAAEIAVDPIVSLWDLAAVKIIVEEAGGAFTDLRGLVTAGGGSVRASNGLVHQAVLGYIGIPAAG